MPADTEHAEAVTVLARAHQDAVWLYRAGNELRSLLRECFPAFLEIFAKQESSVTCREARAILSIASTPGAAAKLTGPRVRAALRRLGTRHRASGRSITVICRRVENQRMVAVGYVWAFASITASPGAHYDRRKDRGDCHSAALRNLFNRSLGCLFHCLQTGQTYQEHASFPTKVPEPATTPYRTAR